METRTHKVYKFEELGEELKQKVLENYWDINVEHKLWNCTYMDAENVGLKIKGFDIDRGSYCDLSFTDSAEYTAHKIMDDHGAKCDTYINAQNYLKERDDLINSAEKDENGDFVDEYELDNHLDSLDSEFLKELSEDYLYMLRNEYEALTSEEAIADTLTANEYDFNEDGKID